MASDEHKQLAENIKSTHIALRCRSNEIGFNKAWTEHLQNHEKLTLYAESMKHLASSFWDKNNNSSSGLTRCRIQWMINCALEYFTTDLRLTEYERELRKYDKMWNKEESTNTTECAVFNKPFKLLDVGSCYNPFSMYDIFDTVAVDIAPADSSVMKCDFLSVPVQGTELRHCENNIESLPLKYFDIVVFSLLLEYFPSSVQRYECCRKASQCLKPEGLLLIATPDSKHATANSKIMKGWRLSLRTLGLARVKVEKLKHINCLAYRKCVTPLCSLLNNVTVCRNPEELIIIPQDSQDYDKKPDGNSGDVQGNVKGGVASHFNELPFTEIY